MLYIRIIFTYKCIYKEVEIFHFRYLTCARNEFLAQVKYILDIRPGHGVDKFRQED